MNTSNRTALGTLCVLIVGGSTTAQCAAWRPRPCPGVNTEVWAITSWDPDGAGPLGNRTVCGGSFTIAGDAVTQIVASYDHATSSWLPLGTNLQGVVKALAVLPNGDLVAAGALWSSTGVQNVARWDGSSWQPLGSGVDGQVTAMTVRPNGEVVVGGFFGNAGTTPTSGIARWNGSIWLPLGGGITSGFCQSLATAPNGDVIAGGTFTQVGGTAAGRIARWDGASWNTIGGGFVGGNVLAIAFHPNGDLLVGGSMWTASNASLVTRWDGTSWSQVGFPSGWVQSLAVLSNGDIVTGRAAAPLYRWDGTAWTTLPGIQPSSSSPMSTINALHVTPVGNLVAGGAFRNSPGATPSAFQNVASWSGSWSAMPPTSDPISNWVLDLAEASNGDIVAAGHFQTIGTTVVNGVARWNGTAWSPIGTGATLAAGQLVSSITALPNGDLVAGGFFGSNQIVATWTGGTWVPMPGAFWPLRVRAGSNGDIAGVFYIGEVKKWNGVGWTSLGQFNPPQSTIDDIAVLHNGNILVAGSFPTSFSPANFACWNGNSWVSLGGNSVNGRVRDVFIASNGDIVIGGDFSSPGNGAARWNGSTWANLALPAGATVDAVGELPGGDLVLVRRDTGMVQRWQGASWLTIGTVPPGNVRCLAVSRKGLLAIGGSFETVNGTPTQYLAFYESTCPATAGQVGMGCSGSGGLATLTPDRLPWLGGSYRATVSGLVAGSIVVQAFGASFTSQPLASVLPTAGQGCLLLIQPTLIDATIATGPVASIELPIPDSTALVGLMLAHQAIVAELAPGGALGLATSSNAIAVEIGDL